MEQNTQCQTMSILLSTEEKNVLLKAFATYKYAGEKTKIEPFPLLPNPNHTYQNLERSVEQKTSKVLYKFKKFYKLCYVTGMLNSK